MQDRLNFTYYKSILRLAQQYSPNAQSVIDVGAPWPFVTAFNCTFLFLPFLCIPSQKNLQLQQWNALSMMQNQ